MTSAHLPHQDSQLIGLLTKELFPNDPSADLSADELAMLLEDLLKNGPAYNGPAYMDDFLGPKLTEEQITAFGRNEGKESALRAFLKEEIFTGQAEGLSREIASDEHVGTVLARIISGSEVKESPALLLRTITCVGNAAENFLREGTPEFKIRHSYRSEPLPVFRDKRIHPAQVVSELLRHARMLDALAKNAGEAQPNVAKWVKAAASYCRVESRRIVTNFKAASQRHSLGRPSTGGPVLAAETLDA